MAEPPSGTSGDGARDALLRELASAREAGEGLSGETRARLARLALDELLGLVAVLSPDGAVLDVNDRALALAQLRREDVAGGLLEQVARPFAAPGDGPRLAAAVRRAAGGELVRQDVVLRGIGGAERTLDVSLRPVRNRTGAVVLLVAEGRDVTETRRARDDARREIEEHAEDAERLAEELRRRKRELETALDAMRYAREQADRASTQKTSLLRMVSHELRTPLAALLLQVDRFGRDAAALTPAQRDGVSRMRSSLRRLTSLVDSLLEYSRIEAGRVTVAPAAVDPAAVAAEVVEELRPLAAGKDLVLSAPAAGSVPPLETDPRLLRLVLFNLVQNAVKFTDAGTVSLSISAEGTDHRISVADSGRGIAAEDQARIFEPFEQLESVARKHTPGVGLGLALVREMVGTLGGRIALESRPGEGSTFTVVLPSRAAATALDAAAAFHPHP